MFERWYASRQTRESAALLERISDAGRAEAQAAAQRLVDIGALFVLRCRDSGERQDWALDTWEAVAAQVAAALRCSAAMASSHLRYAMALRDRLPQLGKAFQAGDIDYRAFQTVVFRTDLITDADTLARVDSRLAVLLTRYPSITRGRLAAAVDQVVASLDRDAVRRAADAARGRFIDIHSDETGMADVTGTLLAAAGKALDGKLDEMAATVCDADPRTREQRRADALGALAAGADRLACDCGSAGCGAGRQAPRSNVVIHVIAERTSIEGTGTAPGVLMGAQGLISAELVAQLAKSARLQPLTLPDGGSEPRYVPSARLADFVRCRDLTCRAPGCDRAALDCDLDHTVAYSQGGRTHPSNVKCLCRKHHLLKTFWGWRDKQLPDGTIIWTLPGGQTYVTTPGSALLFPSLSAPTGELPSVSCNSKVLSRNREARMPRRVRTRRQNRANRINAERSHNRQRRHLAQASVGQTVTNGGARPRVDPDEPPPF
jgi:hypothetical protein